MFLHFYKSQISGSFNTYEELVKNNKHIVLPIGWNMLCDDEAIVFYFVSTNNGDNKMAVVEKQLVFTADENVECYILNCPVQLDDFEMTKIYFPFSSQLVEETLSVLNEIHTCKGGPSPVNFPGIKKSFIINSNNSII